MFWFKKPNGVVILGKIGLISLIILMYDGWEFGRPIEDLELLLVICVFGNLEKPKVVSRIVELLKLLF